MPGFGAIALAIAIVCCLTPPRAYDIYPERLSPAGSGYLSDGLEAWVQAWMEEHHVPGLSACVLIGDSIIWEAHLGLRSICPPRPVTDSTMFMLASVSKTFTGTAVMQLAEAAALDLDCDVAQYLPFTPRNPNHPGIPITLRAMLIHTSSIRDNWEVMLDSYCWGWDSPLTLEEYMPEYFLPGGRYYDAGKNFCQHGPGEKWVYSNMAYALLGYTVECAADTCFSGRTRRTIFDPLAMDHTGWFLAELDTSQVAVPCHWNPDENRWEEYGPFGYPDYPAGQLRSSARDLSRMLTAMLAGGALDGARILDQETLDEMLSPQCPELNPNMGITWRRSVHGGIDTWGHGGGDYGVRTFYGFSPGSNIAAVVLTNGERGTMPVFDRLLQYADSVRTSPSWSAAEAPLTLSVSVSPNPAAASVRALVRLPRPDSPLLLVIDAAGRLADRLQLPGLTRGPHEVFMELDGYPRGVYFAVVRTDRGCASAPFVVLGD